MEEGEGSEPQYEVFGVHRLPLVSGTKSGYVGVRLSKSKKRPWQAWVHIKGEKRRCLGSFNDKRDAAVARAAAIACGVESLPSPRKQAARNSGAEPRVALAHCTPLLAQSLSCALASTHIVISRQSIDKPRPHAPHDAWRERDSGSSC